MKPTEKPTPNNNPILAALLFFMIMVLIIWCFVAVSSYINKSVDGGLGDTEGGVAVFGSGTGDGAGGKDGEKIGDGTEKEQGTAKQNIPKPKTKTDQSSGSAQGDAGKKASGNSSGEKQDETPEWKEPPKDAKIAELQLDESLPQQDDEEENDDPSAPSSFTSGGKTVFKVKKHENVLFIVDISGSMLGATSEGISRLEVLKIQLKKTIHAQLKGKSRGKYGIIAFSDQYYPFPDEQKKQLTFRSAQDWQLAEAWINNMNTLPNGGTYLYPALQYAVQKIQNNEIRVDVIYLLSDGALESYSQTYINLLKQGLPQKVKVHTISIGGFSQLLKDIANAFYGKYEEYK